MRAAVLVLLGALSGSARTYYVTVAGLGGAPEYEQRFGAWARDLETVFKSAPDSQVETLAGPGATRARLEDVLRTIAKQAAPLDALVMSLVGHGSFDGSDYKFNLPGPDITAADLARLLDQVPANRQLIVNMTSASGGSLAALRKQNRVVITATKTGTEKNATLFARYWIEALRDPAADTDKNDAVSALEAFQYAEQKTVKFYESQQRLATEHALLEDTGKGEGVRTPSPQNGEGLLASAFTVVRFGSSNAAVKDPAKRQLLARKEQLEQQIDHLKYQKAAMPGEEYKKQIAVLLLELAKTQAELDK